MIKLYKVTLGDRSVIAREDTAFEVADTLLAEAGGVGMPQIAPYVAPYSRPETPETPEPAPASEPPGSAPAPVPTVSAGFDKPSVDLVGMARAEALQAGLNAAGVVVNAKEQLYATGTRLMAEGYETQAARKLEHDAMRDVRDAASDLVSRVLAEGRRDYTVTAAELAGKVHVNGAVSVFGLKLSEQALRGICTRLESPAMGLLLGLRERIVSELGKPEATRNLAAIKHDKETIGEILRRELSRFPDVTFKLRTREQYKDIFAVVSPSYTPADAPEVLEQAIDRLARIDGTKGSCAYDPGSTAWELRAQVWTPTPTHLHCVGEPFEGYTTLQSRDNGTGRFEGGGGVNLIRCMNATVYSSKGAEVSRVHRGRIMVDIDKMVGEATRAIDVLVKAWGVNRQAVVPLPAKLAEQGVSLNAAIPGFWRALLSDKRSAFEGVLPGRTEKHVAGLALAYQGERRDADRLVRADFAQAWTKYIQQQPAPVRREAERAAGDWSVNDTRELAHLEAV